MARLAIARFGLLSDQGRLVNLWTATEDFCPDTIILVRVIDAAEELTVLQALETLSDQTDAKVASELDGIISTMCRIAAIDRYSSRIVDAREALANQGARCAGR
jgi:hypothetical protein